MRLLNTTTLTLHTFSRVFLPKYAILSHTWGDNEFVFENLAGDMRKQMKRPKRGLTKVIRACEQAKHDSVEWIWIDTCCIDKSSSAELSEAINSMFQWYNGAEICYAYLEDISRKEDGALTHLASSRWFQRGWTLQELIAPKHVLFFDGAWEPLSTRAAITPLLEEITGISAPFLRLCNDYSGLHDLRDALADIPIAVKMQWAANRETTRIEDIAYCLLGLFDVNMPLLYGEGRKAFRRLQEEILRTKPDQSVLLWINRGFPDPHWYERRSDFMAYDPSLFSMLPPIPLIPRRSPQHNDIVLTPRGLELDLWLAPCNIETFLNVGDHETKQVAHDKWLGILSSQVDEDIQIRMGIVLTELPSGFLRDERDKVVILQPQHSSCGDKIAVNTEVIQTGRVRDVAASNSFSANVEIEQAQQKRILLLTSESRSAPHLDESTAPQLTFHSGETGNGYSLKASTPRVNDRETTHILLSENGAPAKQFAFLSEYPVGGAMMFSDDKEVVQFVVIWGSKWDSEEDCLIPWASVESWTAFTEHGDVGEQVANGENGSSRITERELQQHLQSYTRSHTRSGWVPKARVRLGEDGTEAQTQIKKMHFLQRKSLELVVEVSVGSQGSQGSQGSLGEATR